MIRSRSNWVAFIVAFVVTVLTLAGAADALQGGPDKYGYSYVDNYDKNGPKFEMVKFDTTSENYDKLVGGKQFSNLSVTKPYPIGFVFEFYGRKYNNFYISGNGYITFNYGGDITSYVYAGQDVPSSKNPNSLIAPFWSHNNAEG